MLQDLITGLLRLLCARQSRPRQRIPAILVRHVANNRGSRKLNLCCQPQGQPDIFTQILIQFRKPQEP